MSRQKFDTKINGLNIKAVAQLLGVTEHTLRAWETRYQTVSPSRSTSGRRLYSRTEVERLRQLVTLTRRGHSIGEVAQLSHDELQALLTDFSPPTFETPTAPSLAGVAHEGLEEILKAVRHLNLEHLEKLLLQNRLRLSPVQFVLTAVSPLLAEVGHQVFAGDMTIAQEHALSALVRNQLGELLSSIQKSQLSSTGRFRVLLTTPEGDLHEFGILLAAILAAECGAEVKYLGPHLPATSLGEVVLSLKPNLIVLGTTAGQEFLKDGSVVNYLNTFYRCLSTPAPEVWVGGPQAQSIQHSSLNGKKVRHFSSLQMFYEELLRKTHSQS